MVLSNLCNDYKICEKKLAVLFRRKWIGDRARRNETKNRLWFILDLVKKWISGLALAANKKSHL